MMKKILSFVCTILILIGLCACNSFGDVDFKGVIDIPENSIIASETIKSLKDNNEVATFAGESNGYHYEWTVFGSDIENVTDLCLNTYIIKISDDAFSATVYQNEDVLNSALLSITLDEVWDVQSAVVYRNGTPVCSASITGKTESIVNFSLTDFFGEYTIVAENGEGLILADGSIAPEGNGIESEYDEGEIAEGVGTDEYLSGNASQTGHVYYEEKEVGQENVKAENPAVNIEKDEYLSDDGAKIGNVIGEGKSAGQENNTVEAPIANNESDEYLSKSGSRVGRVYSDGKSTEQDKYKTDPIPEGKPIPVEPEDQKINSSNKLYCSFRIECSTIFNNLSDLEPSKLEVLPKDGIIFSKQTVTFSEGESVYDVLQRICEENGIHMEASWTPMYNSAYVEGIHNLYEFDCGNLSGWMYRVNGWYPNYGCSRYQLADGDVVEWRYTCDLGQDVGCDWLADEGK